MGTNEDGNDEIELLRNAVIAIVDMARKANSDQVKLAMDILLAGTSQLGTIFQQRCVQLANQKQPRKAKPPKATPARGPQQPKRPQSNTSSTSPRNAAQERPDEVSSIQQGIRQADSSREGQQRALRRYVYGAQNDEVAFQQAAKAIAR